MSDNPLVHPNYLADDFGASMALVCVLTTPLHPLLKLFLVFCVAPPPPPLVADRRVYRSAILSACNIMQQMKQGHPLSIFFVSLSCPVPLLRVHFIVGVGGPGLWCGWSLATRHTHTHRWTPLLSDPPLARTTHQSRQPGPVHTIGGHVILAPHGDMSALFCTLPPPCPSPDVPSFSIQHPSCVAALHLCVFHGLMSAPASSSLFLPHSPSLQVAWDPQRIRCRWCYPTFVSRSSLLHPYFPLSLHSLCVSEMTPFVFPFLLLLLLLLGWCWGVLLLILCVSHAGLSRPACRRRQRHPQHGGW